MIYIDHIFNDEKSSDPGKKKNSKKSSAGAAPADVYDDHVHSDVDI